MSIGVNGRFLTARATGVQRFAHHALAALVERADVVLFLPGNAAVPQQLRAHVVGLRGTLRGHAWEQLELPRMAAHGSILVNLANTAPLRLKHQLVMIHDILPITHPQWFAPAFSAWYGYLTPRLLARARGILTSSQHTAREIRKLPSGRNADITVVPQGIAPFGTPAEPVAVERVRARLGPTYVLALGAGEPRKNVAFAIDVVQDYRRRYGAALTLAVVGTAPVRVHGQTRPASSGEGVVFLGNVTDAELHALYTGAAALLYPTLGEGFGRPPLEAMGCGTPVLASNYAAGAETLADSSARRLSLDVMSWADALHELIESNWRIDAAERAVLNARWSWTAAADAIVGACAQVAAATPAAAGAL